MSAEIPAEALALRSLVRADQTLELTLDTVPVPQPGPDEVIIRVEATPLNPSDMGLLFGGADMAAGAVHVCNSTSADFMPALIDALRATGATLAFDAIGGGRLASQVLTGMETVASAAA